MKARFRGAPGDAWAWCTRSLQTSWREPSPRLHPASTALELPLCPSPRLRRGLRYLALVMMAFVLELVLGGHLLAASLVALLAVGGFWPGRGDRWRCLRMEVDGQLILMSRGGTSLPVRLEACGLRLGQHLLLVLRSRIGRHTMLLGPDNAAPDLLAALKLRLPD